LKCAYWHGAAAGAEEQAKAVPGVKFASPVA